MFSPSAYLKAAQQCGYQIDSTVILQHGVPLFRHHTAKPERRLQHSISKSFIGMAVGLALSEKRLSSELPLGACFGRGAPGSAITLRDLLTMSSGHGCDVLSLEKRTALANAGTDWVEFYMRQPLCHAPGSRFYYSSGDTFMISALLQELLGCTVAEYLTPRLFEPLGIHSVRWDLSPCGRTLGCSGFYLTTSELAAFGALLLQKGLWQGQRLIPEQWIEASMRKQIETGTDGPADWRQGYGYQFWMCTHGAVRADGMHGQFCILLPQVQTVVAINACEDDMQGILNLVWAYLLPEA